MTDINELLKLYDNAIYLDDASEEDIKRLLKLSRIVIDSVYDLASNCKYDRGRLDFTVGYIFDSLCEILDTIEDYKEIRV